MSIFESLKSQNGSFLRPHAPFPQLISPRPASPTFALGVPLKILQAKTPIKKLKTVFGRPNPILPKNSGIGQKN